MFTVMFTAIGKRVELVRAFKSSFEKNGIMARVIGVDINPSMAPAGYFLDRIDKVAKATDDGYIEDLLRICTEQQVDMLIPLYEPEFTGIVENRQQFGQNGTKVVLSDKKALKICSDKYKTFGFFEEAGIKTPKSWLSNQLPSKMKFPLFVKPCCGMGSMGAQKVFNNVSLTSALEYSVNMIIQQYIEGTEYTLDVLADFNGQVLSVVPRQRLEVRAGEVSKSKTADRPDLIEQAVYIVERLGAIGPLTLQCIDTGSEVYWIEINPRFGGGVPLAIQAGVDYPYLLYRMLKGETVSPFLGQYTKNLGMLRYDEAIYTTL
jgi:carbamoyl-phosphate synthase large subunit